MFKFHHAKVIIALMAFNSFGVYSQDLFKSEFRSPDGKYVVRNFVEKVGKDYRCHAALINIKTGNEICQIKYDRSIDVVWSDVASVFYLNDFCASNQTEAYIYFVGEQSCKRENIRVFLSGKKDVVKFFDEHHCYIELLGWDGLKVRGVVKGYGDKWPRGFKKDFVVNLEDRFGSSVKREK